MSIVNQIAAFGRDAGSGITSGLNEARRRKESDRSYNSIQQRYDLQDKRYNNEISRMEQERQQQAQETERQYAADGVQAIYSAPPEFRAQAYQGWLQGAQQRGYDVAGAPPEYSDEVLYKLAGSVGANLKPDSSNTPTGIQEMQYVSNIINNPENYPEATVKAARIKAGLDPRAVGSSGMTIVNTGMTQPVAQSEGVIAGAKAGATENAKLDAQLTKKPDVEAAVTTATNTAKENVDKRFKQPKALAALKQAQSKWDIVDQKISEALNDISGWTAGTGGVFLSKLPGTEATDLKNTLDTIRANIGFDELQQMRDNSPTGGALGQVSEMENRLLQAVKGSTQQEQSPEQLKQNLKDIQKWLKGLRQAKKDAYEADFGAAKTGGSTLDDLVNKYAD